jgi:hypothetical protein
MDPSDDYLVCHNERANPRMSIFGLSLKESEDQGELGRRPKSLELCGPDRKLFEQHPSRNPDGSLA